MKTRLILIILFAASLGLRSASAELIAFTWWNPEIWWKPTSGPDEALSSYEEINPNDPSSFPFTGLNDTRYGITLSLTDFTSSGFSFTTSAVNPTPGVQWSQYIFSELRFDVPTAFTLSGTLYSTNPTSNVGLGAQYVYVYDYAADAYVFALNEPDQMVVGPQTYSFSGVFQPNIYYAVAGVNSWTTTEDGFEGNFMTLALGEPAPAVPEPGTWAAAALLVGGGAFMRWRKGRGKAEKKAA